MPTRLLVASIGNPAPYASTFHSAGHSLLEALREALSYPRFSRALTISPGLSSSGPEYTLYQSPTFMNFSGKAVANAYNSFVRNLPTGERNVAQLVVLHDELEAPLGKIKMKTGGSARGHNGIKSVIEAMGGREFVRIGVGIGRPKSRDSGDVADYVLKKMKPAEIERVREGAGEVLRILERLRNG